MRWFKDGLTVGLEIQPSAVYNKLQNQSVKARKVLKASAVTLPDLQLVWRSRTVLEAPAKLRIQESIPEDVSGVEVVCFCDIGELERSCERKSSLCDGDLEMKESEDSIEKCFRGSSSKIESLFLTEEEAKSSKERIIYLCDAKVFLTQYGRIFDEFDVYQSSLPSEILDGFLFHGDAEHASSIDVLQKLAISCVIVLHTSSLAWDHPLAVDKPVNAVYMNIEDDAKVNFPINECVEFLKDCEASGKRTLVCCRVGRSRSTSAILAFLISSRNWNLERSFLHVRSRRCLALPNEGFWLQLQNFAAGLSGLTPLDADFAALSRKKLKKYLALYPALRKTFESVLLNYSFIVGDVGCPLIPFYSKSEFVEFLSQVENIMKVEKKLVVLKACEILHSLFGNYVFVKLFEIYEVDIADWAGRVLTGACSELEAFLERCKNLISKVHCLKVF